MLKTTLLGASLGAALLLPAATDVYFEPASGAEIERSFTLTAEGGIEDVIVTVMGMEQDVSDTFEGADLDDASVDSTLEWSITDVIASARRGRVLELERTFGSLLVDGEEPEDEAGEDTPKSVRFTWDDDADDYAIEILDEDASEEAQENLDLLIVDMDHLPLLPEQALEAGESWSLTLDTQGLAELLAPGFRLAAMRDPFLEGMTEDGDLDLADAEAGLEQFEAALSGAELTLTFVGEEERDGVDCAVIGLELAHSGEVDLSELAQLAMEEGMEEGQEIEAAAGIEIELDGEGQLLWSLADNRLLSMTLAGDLGLDAYAEMTIAMEGFEVPFDMEGSAAFAYELTQTAE